MDCLLSYEGIQVKSRPDLGENITTTRVFLFVLLALVDAKYGFLRVDIFNHCKLKKIKDGTFRLPPPNPRGQGGLPLHYFVQGDDTFTLKPWLL